MIFSISSGQYDQLEVPESSASESIHRAVEMIRQYISGADEFSFYTSGTTGKRKTITFSRSSLRAGIIRTINHLHLTSNDRFYCCLSPETTGGAMVLYRAAELRAALTIAPPQSDPFSELSSMHDYTVISLAPIQLFTVLTIPAYLSQLNRFRLILIGGAPVSSQIEALLSACTAACYETYGMTETASHIALRRIGSDTAFWVMDGIDITTDERGCLCVRADVTGNEWVVTNDVVERIGEQQFRVKGRADLIINTGGIKVHPEETEALIHQHFPLLTCFVTGIPDERLGQRLTLFTEGDHAIDKQVLQSVLSKNLTPYHIPRVVVTVEHFIYTSGGKIDRTATVRAAGY